MEVSILLLLFLVHHVYATSSKPHQAKHVQINHVQIQQFIHHFWKERMPFQAVFALGPSRKCTFCTFAFRGNASDEDGSESP